MNTRASMELSDGNHVELASSIPLTSRTFEEVLEYLAVLRRVLRKREGSPSHEDAPGTTLEPSATPAPAPPPSSPPDRAKSALPGDRLLTSGMTTDEVLAQLKYPRMVAKVEADGPLEVSVLASSTVSTNPMAELCPTCGNDGTASRPTGKPLWQGRIAPHEGNPSEEERLRVEASAAMAYGLDPKNAGKSERVIVGDPKLKELPGEGPAPVIYEPGKPLPEQKDPRPRCIECKRRWQSEPGVDATCTPCPVCAGRTGEEKAPRVSGGTMGEDARREFETRERICQACKEKGGDKDMGKSFKANRQACERCGEPTVEGFVVRKREFRGRPVS